jgi:hypothetical protein
MFAALLAINNIYNFVHTPLACPTGEDSFLIASGHWDNNGITYWGAGFSAGLLSKYPLMTPLFQGRHVDESFGDVYDMCFYDLNGTKKLGNPDAGPGWTINYTDSYGNNQDPDGIGTQRDWLDYYKTLLTAGHSCMAYYSQKMSINGCSNQPYDTHTVLLQIEKDQQGNMKYGVRRANSNVGYQPW